MKVELTSISGAKSSSGKAHDKFVEYCRARGFTNYASKTPSLKKDYSVLVEVDEGTMWKFIQQLMKTFEAEVIVSDKFMMHGAKLRLVVIDGCPS